MTDNITDNITDSSKRRTWANVVKNSTKSDTERSINNPTANNTILVTKIEEQQPSRQYQLIDFGVNYSGHELTDNNVRDIINESVRDGVTHVVCISNGMTEARNNVRLAGIIPQLHFTLGVHPHNAKTFRITDLEYIEQHISNPKCFGIGEIGLDFNRNFSNEQSQIFAFTEQLKLAKKLNAKVYLHCRDAYNKFIEIIKSVGYYKGIVHCFTGSLEQALELTGLGFKLGITGWLLDRRRNQDLVAAVSDNRITIDMLLVETDAPYMSVHKKKRNSTPPDVDYVIKEIARLKNLDENECGKQLYRNAIEFL